MARDLTERIENSLIRNKPINGLAQAVQQVMNRLFLKSPLRPIKVFMNGTWLEHPLHPLLTDIPVGAWTLAILLDLIALIFGVSSLGLASAIAVGLGILGALGAAATGLFDWMDIDRPELAVGITHAVINIAATVLFIVSFAIRWTGDWTISLAAFIPAVIGYIVVSAGAYIGGSLVYRQGVMVNRDAHQQGPNEYVPVLATQDLPENRPVRVDAQGQPVLLVRRGEEVYAIGAVCSHYGGPLEEGQLKDGTIECPWHYSRFRIADGGVDAGPATAPVPAYEARVVDGHIEVRAKETTA
ncbi:MAG: Rieske 2Fe-2S domain-containing protein [Chloroflexi bacterium]|nr:Rieske 2Fe-2S domain-containing protein [Chloroflexota bacterium]